MEGHAPFQHLILSVVLLLTALAQSLMAQGRVVVGPNVQVSMDGDVAHVESSLAADPANPLHLVGTAITFTAPTHAETKAYSSFDGGWTWVGASLPENNRHGAWDTQPGIGSTGTAYMVTMQFTGDTAGYDAIAFYRSENGGETWERPVHLGSNGPYDRPGIVVDQSHGRFRGHVYVTATTGDKTLGLAELFRSADDGRTFDEPRNLQCRGAESPLVLSDGTLWVDCTCDLTTDHSFKKSAECVTTSLDGGVTFTPFTYLPFFNTNAVYAVDTSARFRDRIYAVQLEQSAMPRDKRSDKQRPSRAVLRYSTDRGRSWSTPQPVAPPGAAGATQYLPAIAVNGKGVLGVFWFETTEPNFNTYYFPGTTLYFRSNTYFTASLDGGLSFLQPRRVSTKSSSPANPENLAITQIKATDPGKHTPSFFTAYSRWRDAGDYTGLTATVDGAFHPFWPDARRGAFQLYTSRIEIDSTARIPTAVRSTREVDKETEILFGPPVVPQTRSSGDMLLARIRNVSTDTICGPLSAEVKVKQPLAVLRAPKMARLTQIFDASAARWDTAATIDYRQAMGDLVCLAPGATTEAVEWHFKNAALEQLELVIHIRAGDRPGSGSRKAASLPSKSSRFERVDSLPHTPVYYR